MTVSHTSVTVVMRPWGELDWHLFRVRNPQSSQQMQSRQLSPFFPPPLSAGAIPGLGACGLCHSAETLHRARGDLMPRVLVVSKVTRPLKHWPESHQLAPYKLPKSHHMETAGIYLVFTETFYSVNAGHQSALNPSPQHQSLAV